MKLKKHYICTQCGTISPKWAGQCYECENWGTIHEEVISSNKNSIGFIKGSAQKLSLLDETVKETIRIPTSIGELNRVLGGGLVSSSTILIGGDPGIGKSTLLLQLAARFNNMTATSLYVTGEESVDQIKLRALRLGINSSSTKLLAASSVEDIIATIEANKSNIQLVIIDSIQTVASNEISSPPGTVSQIKLVTQELISYTKKNNIALFISCHVTKEGQIAGPKILEHMVDTVLYFEGDHNNHYRILRSMKNRFGPVNEIGVFEMTDKGLIEVSNPSALFLMERENNVSGTAVFAGIEGSRALLMEIQALTAPSNIPTPRRSVVGWDPNRLAMIIAVLARRFGLNLSSQEVYLTVTGGIKITEPAADLAVAAALISAAIGKALPTTSVFFGEVGLSGEVRKVNQSETRIKESLKLGFSNIVCSNIENVNKQVHSIAHLKQLKDFFN